MTETGSKPVLTDSRGDSAAAALRGFGPIGILALLAIIAVGAVAGPLFAAILVLFWVSASRTPWRDIGYVRPRSWIATVAIGVVFGVVFKLVMKAIVMPLLGAPEINQAYRFITGNPAAIPGMLFSVIVGAGFGEETLWRGYLFERLRRLIGSNIGAQVAIVGVTAVMFGAVHYPDQGLAGAQQATIVGLVYGSIFAVTGRLFMLMIAHAAFDVTAVAIIYWDLETTVARLIFR